MCRMPAHSRKRNLMRAEFALNRNTIHFLRTCPAFRGAQNDHRPRLPRELFICPSFLLGFPYARVAAIERTREKLVHLFGLVPFHENRRVAMPREERTQFFVARARHD